ncbi:hypothetical protein BGZ76_001451 [Entomortierella beljakovae]|nr:hypothetical protein BGZ76_001451 [Entomortierella beljakovae]
MRHSLRCLQAPTSMLESATCKVFVLTLMQSSNLFCDQDSDSDSILQGDLIPELDLLPTLLDGHGNLKLQSGNTGDEETNIAKQKQRWVLAIYFLELRASLTQCESENDELLMWFANEFQNNASLIHAVFQEVVGMENYSFNEGQGLRLFQVLCKVVHSVVNVISRYEGDGCKRAEHFFLEGVAAVIWRKLTDGSPRQYGNVMKKLPNNQFGSFPVN